MPGMNSGLDLSNPTLVAAFRSALLAQLGIIAGISILLLIGYLTLRNRLPSARKSIPAPEPRGRRVLRIGFGILWLVDGILQVQPKMVVGLPSQVIEPAAASSPRWVQDVVNWGGTIWSYHPVQAAAAAVWIQAGLGLWLIVAETGWWSRLAGIAGLAWGLIVWVFGEGFGAIFAPGLSWLTGAPGAVLLYVAAGALIALPLRAWAGPRLGRIVLAGTGAFWVGMAVLQAWPGRGFWQGGDSGTLAGMVQDMAGSEQPRAQESMISAFASLDTRHGFAVNLFAVIVLLVLGLGLLALAFDIGPRPALLRWVVPAAVLFCLADWVLVQDFGMPGGLGTDPNSMVPWVLLLWAGYLGVVRADSPAGARERFSLAGVRQHFSLAAVRAALRPEAVRSAADARSVAAFGALAVVLVGAAPMAAASANKNADPIIARAVAGESVTVNQAAPDFRLVSESGQQVSLASLRGKAVLLTFLDPVCGSCKTIAHELKLADAMLGASASDTELIAIAADPLHTNPVFFRAFDKQAGMTAVPNWRFLTGTVAELQHVWNSYEKIAPHMIVGMNAYSNVTFVIDKAGRIRQEIKDNPGPSTTSTRSSFAVLMSDAARQSLDFG
jgi:cytochrome oxidase Cu insertion factor (SCO1/SenC/PrrC family)